MYIDVQGGGGKGDYSPQILDFQFFTPPNKKNASMK